MLLSWKPSCTPTRKHPTPKLEPSVYLRIMLTNIMLTNSAEAVAGRRAERDQALRRAPLRVAIVSDLLEEQWPSMDLVADMLTESFQTQPSYAVAATQIRPAMRCRLGKTPLVGNRRTVRNLDRLFNRFVDYPRWLRGRKKDFDLFHIVDHSYSQVVHVLPPQRTVVT